MSSENITEKAIGRYATHYLLTPQELYGSPMLNSDSNKMVGSDKTALCTSHIKS